MLTQEAQRDRPESDLGKGRYEVSVLTVSLFAGAAVVLLLVFVAVVVIKRVRTRREELGPVSSRGSVRPGPPSQRPRPL